MCKFGMRLPHLPSRVHWPTKNNRHLKILRIDKMQNSTSLWAIPSSSTMEVRIKTTLPVVQNMRATKHKTSTLRKKRQVPPFCRGKMPHRYLDNPGTTKSHWKEVRHHVRLRSLELQATFKGTFFPLHKNVYETQTTSFWLAFRMWHRGKKRNLSRWPQSAWTNR